MSEQSSGRDDPRFRQVDRFDQYADVDLARTYGFTRSEEAQAVDSKLLDAQQEVLLRDGYIILEDIVAPEVVTRLREESAEHLDHVGRNSFEGERTQRIYGVPEKLRAADPFIEHPLILGPRPAFTVRPCSPAPSAPPDPLRRKT